ncbi:MAG TPA: metallophosphoesterase [Clostridia bacterium]|nr:metallophosphoesterase [Clostridia bacterium]
MKSTKGILNGKKLDDWLKKDFCFETQGFSGLEKYIYFKSQSLPGASNEIISQKFRECLCSIINVFQLPADILKPETISIDEIKRFIDSDFDRYYNRLFDHVSDYDQEIEEATILRLCDWFRIPEVETLREYIFLNIRDILRGGVTVWTDFFYYCRSDTFLSNAGIDIIAEMFSQWYYGYFPTLGYSSEQHLDEKRWKNRYRWEEYDDHWKKIYDRIDVAATYLFIWCRCKHLLSSDKRFFAQGAKIAKKAFKIIMEHQLGDSGWGSNSKSKEVDFETTCIVAHALSMYAPDSATHQLKCAHEWLSKYCDKHDDLIDFPAQFVLCSDSLFLCTGEYSCVTFNTESGTRPSAKGLPKARIRFLHLSDLHYNPRDDGGESESMRKDLLNELSNLVKSGKKVDELIITGDFRHAKYQSGIKAKEAVDHAVEYIRKIASAIGIEDYKHIHIVPGNHDLNREKIKESDVETLREEYKKNKGKFTDEHLKKINSQFWFFRMICSKLYGSKLNPWKGVKLHTYYCDGKTIFLCLNTAALHHSSEDRGKLLVGTRDIEIQLENACLEFPGYPIVVLAHHSPDFFSIDEKQKIERLFEKYPVALYLCGDAHSPWWRMVNCHLEFTVGCIKVEDKTQATYMYGNTNNNEFQSFIWDINHGWGEYDSFNKSLDKFLEKMSLKAEHI